MKKGKCCGIGCLLVVLVVGGLGVGGYFWGKDKLAEFVTQFTGEKPVPIEAPEGTQEQVASVFTRFDNFRNGIASGSPSAPLVLSDHDINLLMFHHSNFEAVSGKTNVKIENDQLSAKISLNLDEYADRIPMIGEMLRGRYLNGDATVVPSLKDGKPQLFLEGLTVNGMALPPEVIKELQKKNLFEDVQTKDELNKAFEKIEEIKIEGNKLHIVPRK